jgi:hypothetical protein
MFSNITKTMDTIFAITTTTIKLPRRIPGPEHLQEEPLLGKRKERDWDSKEIHSHERVSMPRRIPGPENLQKEPLLGKRKERDW